jgi:hypothetical protein
MTGERLEVLHFADLVDFRNHSIENRFDFLIRILREKRPLIFETDLVPEKLFAVKIGNSLSSAFFDSH